MRVLQVINSLEIGGAENILHHIIPKMNKRDVKTDVFVFFEKGELLKNLKSKKTHVITPSSSNLVAKFLELVRFLKKEDYDVVHTHLGISNYLGRTAALITGIPKIVMHEHGGLLEKSLFKRIVSRLLHTFTDHICYISEHDLEYFSKLDFFEDSPKNVLLSNPSLYQVEPSPIREEIKKIGMVGRLTVWKGHIYALKAFKKLKTTGNDIEYILLGYGEKDTENELVAYADKHDLNFRIIKGESDLTEYYESFDILVHPSISEGFGLVIVEAMSFGIPVVASDVGGIPDIIEDGHNGLLAKPRNPESIYRSIKKLIENYELRKKISANALQIIEEKYSLENYVNRLIKLYES